MSSVVNLQGSMTQTQQVSQLNQQLADAPKEQQLQAENQQREANAKKATSVQEQDEAKMNTIQKEEKDPEHKKHNRKKKPLNFEDDDLPDVHGGSLINTLA